MMYFYNDTQYQENSLVWIHDSLNYPSISINENLVNMICFVDFNGISNISEKMNPVKSIIGKLQIQTNTRVNSFI